MYFEWFPEQSKHYISAARYDLNYKSRVLTMLSINSYLGCP